MTDEQAPDGAGEAPPAPAEPKLPPREFGRSRERVSQLALGTWGLSGDAYGPVYHKEVDRVIDRAIELGITVFETADVYGDGKMEEKLGAALDPKEHMVVTKLGTFKDDTPPRKKFDPDSLQRAFDKSRERLARERIDVVLLHNPSLSALEDGGCVRWLRERIAAEELRYWGVSCDDVEVARKAMSESCDCLALPYNLFHQKTLHEIADEVASTETAVLARSVLSHGLLAGHWPKSKVFFDNDHRSQRWSREEVQYRIEQLVAVRQLVDGDVLTLRSAALRFVLCNQLVTTAVLGPRSVTQLNQLVHEVGKGPDYLSSEALKALPERLAAVGIDT